MDAVNERLLAVLQERARLVLRIAAHKRRLRLPIADPEREQAMLAVLLRVPGAGFPPVALERLLRAVFAESRQLALDG
jgi:chorismate mutase